jgi:hypothetical protein
LYRKLTIKFLVLVIFLALANYMAAQVKNVQDTIKTSNNKELENPKDTIPEIIPDSMSVDKKDDDEIKSPINYSAKDSMMFSYKTKMIYSYGDAKLGMEEMKLNAGHMVMNMDSNYVYATSLKDSEGKMVGDPIFEQGSEKYTQKALKYNFKTQKGIVYDIISEQGGGYVHAHVTKMHPNKEIHMADGKFTTCDAEHPHFYVHMTRAKVILDKKIISGPFNFVIADIPLPIGLPFGWFPIRKNKAAGFILPSFTEEQRRGFGLQRGGYYYPISDYVDLTVLGEIWTSGSWGIDVNSNYRKRYKYSGSANISYKKYIELDESSRQDFWVKANYNRDQKASPSAQFNASLNFGSSKFRQLNSYDINQAANNTTNSSITYSKTFPNFNFSANLSGTQNLTTHQVNLTLPTITFNMTKKLKPFERKISTGNKRWYEEVQIGFTSGLGNSLDIADSLLFKKEALDKMENGYNYNIPVSTSIKIFKYLNLNPSFSYKGRIYTKRLEQKLDTSGKYVPDTLGHLGHVYDFSFSAPINTTIYGMFQFKKGWISAIRHVMSPSIGFGYKPDFGEGKWGYYEEDRNYPNENKRFSRYFGIYGTAPTGKSGSISFSLNNNLEMKVHSKDTAEKFKKIILLNGLNFGTDYTIGDSIPWAPLKISANTMLFKQISVTYSSNLDFYKVDSLGSSISKTYLKDDSRLGRFTHHNISLSGTISSETFKKKKDKGVKPDENNDDLNMETDDFEQEDPFGKKDSKNKGNVDKENKPDADGYSFSLPWSLSISYTYSNLSIFQRETQNFKNEVQQNLSLNGNLTLTSKWRINGSATFDLTTMKLQNTNWNITRDLHCWNMSLGFTPFGNYKYYSFRISVNSSLFQGLEYKKTKSPVDNSEFN